MKNFAPSAEAPSVVVLCGGTGGANLLDGLKDVAITTAIVAASDNGGSTGNLRERFDMPPVGDIRQCLAAQAEDPDLGSWFNKRFGDEYQDLSGHAVGNLLLAQYYRENGRDLEAAIEQASELLQVRGTVLPVTLGNHQLVLDDAGVSIVGESKIGRHKIKSTDASIRLTPDAIANPKAEKAIMDADVVVISPGIWLCSTLPVLAVKGIGRALRQTPAIRAMVTNLFNKSGHTDGWHVGDYVNDASRYIGECIFDYVLYNDSMPPAKDMDRYVTDNSWPVTLGDVQQDKMAYELIGSNFMSDYIVRRDPNDKSSDVQRSRVRHNAEEIARIILDILPMKRKAADTPDLYYRA